MKRTLLAGLITPLITKTVVANAAPKPKPPVVTITPNTQTLNEGDPMTATADHVKESGHTYTYLWQTFDGSWQDLLGGTTQTFTIASITSGNAGRFRCIVTDSTTGLSGTSNELTVN
ncbi:immunoglobulin domain-containing protein [Vibrio sp. ER1A]|uniref:immunoglobulin domain-containing protein n=1 Tax=Vibrio sp. ER1A TaxID=1517681 RepID=UPI0004DD4218|nr:immunoglobulin domain-containing protein [Vibrio sp. ER1A]KFA99465.1 hypothetical protein HW45_03645 [Vibrio sp. ER1A]